MTQTQKGMKVTKEITEIKQVVLWGEQWRSLRCYEWQIHE